MTDQPLMIAVDRQALDALMAEVRALRAQIERLRVEPEPEWLTIREYASRVGRSERTVRDWIAKGKVKTRTEGKVTLVRSPG